MKKTLVRVGRTFTQSFLGVFLSTGVLSAMADSGTVGSAAVWQKAIIAAGAAGIISVVSFIQNWLEDTKDVNLGPK